MMTQLKLSGILSLPVTDELREIVARARKNLPNDAIPLRDDDLHITLWKLGKEARAELKNRWKNVGPISFDSSGINAADDVFMIEREGRRSWIVVVDKPGQIKLRECVDSISNEISQQLCDYEHERPFHISIANLTGSPFDSVGDVMWSDMIGESQDVDTRKDQKASHDQSASCRKGDPCDLQPTD